MTATRITIDDLVERDARESSGIHDHSSEAFSIAVERNENALELFHHPFGCAENRDVRWAATATPLV